MTPALVVIGLLFGVAWIVFVHYVRAKAERDRLERWAHVVGVQLKRGESNHELRVRIVRAMVVGEHHNNEGSHG